MADLDNFLWWRACKAQGRLVNGLLRLNAVAFKSRSHKADVGGI